MSFRKDFHGGRTYSADPPGSAPGLGFRLALGLAWLRSRLRGMLGVASPAAEGHPAGLEPGPFPPPADPPQDAQQRLVSMFQVFEGPGASVSLRRPAARRRPAETQDI